MVRDVNKDYVLPLESTFPVDHRGAAGDTAKVACATCHQGVQKPLNGVSMIGAHPELSKITAGLTPYAAGLMPTAAVAAVAAPAAVVPAVVALPETVYGKILFETGKTVFGPAGQQEIKAAVDALKNSPDLKVDLSGFADSRGDPAKNAELAKQRAIAVRDALVGAGIATDRINFRKPSAPVAGGAEADSRRVEIVSAK